jgi:hypothetical protein
VAVQTRQSGAQLREWDGAAGPGESPGDALVYGGGRRLGRRAALDHLQGERIAALSELEGDRGPGGRRAKLDGEREVVGVTAEVEVRVAPGVEFGGAAQGLPGADAAAAFLAWCATATAARWPRCSSRR